MSVQESAVSAGAEAGAGPEAGQILQRCDELAAVSAMEGGIERVYLTEEHARVNRMAARWMSDAGMHTWQDAAGSQCGRLEGRKPGLPALLLGSHLDTVPDAGRYDGILGVLLAIAVVHRLRPRAAELPFALEVVAFGDEEGTRFGATLLGSRALAGTWDDTWWGLVDKNGITLAEAYRRFGLEPGRIGDAARNPEDLVGYLEAHIEQGPYLEAAGKQLGVVTSIAGARRFELSITGEARHAGGTPYERRRDALVGAGEAIVAIERLAKASGGIATVGSLVAHPGAVNVIAGKTDFSLDLRAEHDPDRDALWSAMEAEIDAICARRGLHFAFRETHSAPGVRCAPTLRGAVESGISATGDLNPMALYSKAGHDAMAVAAVTDMAMLFVRCDDGISHSPEESVLASDVAAALDAFEAAVLTMAERMDASGPAQGTAVEG